MPNSVIAPGTVLGGRYRVDVLLQDIGPGRFWRATDLVLSRSVAIHALLIGAAGDEALIEAARRSATVVDARLLRVLDCDQDDRLVWVVNEWGEGTSLDKLLDYGPLDPMRAAWIVREAASVLAVAHDLDVAHGALNPEAVLITNEGELKIIGFAVSAAFHQKSASGRIHAATERESDVVNLAGLLYAGLTARWVGATESRIKSAPFVGSVPLRPRQVQAGVPRILDTVCERVLRREAINHAMPIETAHEIAAVLSDFVGDEQLAMPSFWQADQSADAARAFGGDDSLWMSPVATGETPRVPPTSDDVPPAAAEDVPTQVGQDRSPWATDAASLNPVTGPEPAVDPDATAAHAALDATALAAPPPPPFEDIPERPLFASDKPRPNHKGRAAYATGDFIPLTGEPAGHGGPGGVSRPSGSGGSEDKDPWLFASDGTPPADYDDSSPRRWWRMALVAFVILVLLAAATFFLSQWQRGGQANTERATPTRTTSESASGAPLKIDAVYDLDPEGDPARENPEQTPLVFDGDPATGWTTSTYYGDPAFGRLKRGLGLVVDLGDVRRIGSATVRLTGDGTGVELYAAPKSQASPPPGIDNLTKLAADGNAGGEKHFSFDKVRTRYVVVWLTKLPEASGGFRGQIDEITVRS